MSKRPRRGANDSFLTFRPTFDGRVDNLAAQRKLCTGGGDILFEGAAIKHQATANAGAALGGTHSTRKPSM